MKDFNRQTWVSEDRLAVAAGIVLLSMVFVVVMIRHMS
jgi:hypothetical protein